jgi:hypothetical protein
MGIGGLASGMWRNQLTVGSEQWAVGSG